MNPFNKIKAGIIGGAGYTGGELIRLLLNHEAVEITFVQSKSNAGKFLYQVHTDLLGETEQIFSTTYDENVDVLFLCGSHGQSTQIIEQGGFCNSAKIIDLSQDFRIAHQKNNFTYGLPELNKENIKKARNLANPGCFATCITLALLPLAEKKLLNSDIHISATTGSTGAGQLLNVTSHFSWRYSNLSVYKPFEHQHLNEIEQSIKTTQSDFDKAIHFIPHRGSFARGILASIYVDCILSLEEIEQIFESYYKNEPFVFISKDEVDLKQVVNTNKCFLGIKKYENKVLIVSTIDNLLKGAAGQAVQNMNLMFGIHETSGLKLKALAF